MNMLLMINAPGWNVNHVANQMCRLDVMIHAHQRDIPAQDVCMNVRMIV